MSGLASRSRCILCCISIKLAEPMPRLPSPGIPPKPPRPKGEAPMSAGAACGGGGGEAAAPDEDGGGEAAAAAGLDPAAPADCLMTRWTVMPSLTLWEVRVSVSFMILPAKMRQRFSRGALPNLLEMACLN